MSSLQKLLRCSFTFDSLRSPMVHSTLFYFNNTLYTCKTLISEEALTLSPRPRCMVTIRCTVVLFGSHHQLCQELSNQL